MMNEDISQNRQLGLFRWDFAMIGSKRCAETLQGGSRVKFVDLPLHLLRYEFSLEVWDAESCVSFMHYTAGTRRIATHSALAFQ